LTPSKKPQAKCEGKKITMKDVFPTTTLKLPGLAAFRRHGSATSPDSKSASVEKHTAANVRGGTSTSRTADKPTITDVVQEYFNTITRKPCILCSLQIVLLTTDSRRQAMEEDEFQECGQNDFSRDRPVSQGYQG
jgi:hypothetical protein